MDILEIFNEYNIDYKTEGHKHCRPGWVNIPCPFCEGNPGYHLGINIKTLHSYCWRCGWKPIDFALSGVLKITKDKIPKLGLIGVQINTKQEEVKNTFTLPSAITPLLKIHKKYLQKRGYNTTSIEKNWNVYGTSPSSCLVNNGKKINFKYRIIIPIFWDGKIVSFTSRDITEKAPIKYISCPNNMEVIEHKHILYGRQDKWNETGICVEGPTDVWKMGFSSFATFGIEYTIRQLILIKKTFKNVAVLYDDDPQAIVKAEQLVAELQFRRVNAFRVPITGDPGSLQKKEANYLSKQITKKIYYAAY